MTVTRARILKASELERTAAAAEGAPPTTRRAVAGARAVRIPRETVDARAEAAAVLARASHEAQAIVDAARAAARDVAERAAREAADDAEAKAAARHLALRAYEAKADERALDRTVELAVLLAERLLGERIAQDPARLLTLARTALAEARGARRVRLEVRPEDEPRLREALAGVSEVIDITADASLGPGSLVLDTDVGTVDARLRPQLERLAAALRAALAEMGSAAR